MVASSTDKDNASDAGNSEKSKSNFFNAFHMPHMDTEKLMNHYKKNLEILGSINKMSAEVYANIAQMHSTFVKQTTVEINDLIQKKGKPSDTVAKFSEFTKDNVVKAVNNCKQISTLLATTHQSINAAILKRFRESVDELKRKKHPSDAGNEQSQ
ncbi:MAG: hypothetical protein LBJ19_01635 [Holosporaceae bacterium]|jgi:hypothetical protein|nr:hypothetical protein [Holosporaceae bacterium]